MEPDAGAEGEPMHTVIPMLLVASHVVTFILGYSFGAYVYFRHWR